MRSIRTTRAVTILLAICVLGASAPTPAHAANDFSPLAPELTPSFETIGFVIPFVGDDNYNASVGVEIKLSSAVIWAPIHPAARTPDRTGRGGTGPSFAGRAFWLAEDTNYDLRFTFMDPDGVTGPLSHTVTEVSTRRSPSPEATDNTFYLSPDGDDSNSGTLAEPWASFAHAVSMVNPGDTVKVRGGTYHEVEFELNNLWGGNEGSWTIFEPYEDETPVIDGSDPVLQVPGQGNWTPHPNQAAYPGVWSTDVGSHAPNAACTPRVSWGSEQNWLVPYFESEDCPGGESCSLEDLAADASGLGKGGWHLDTDNSEGLGSRVLFVKLPGGIDPNSVPMYVARTSYLFLINDSDYVAVRGMTIRHAFHCLTSWNSQRLLLEGNTVHSCVYPIELRHDEGEFVTVQDNEVFEIGMVESPKQGSDSPLWRWIKRQTEVERQGLKVVDAGNGHVFRRNNVHDVFNGSIFEDHADRPLKNLEVYDNTFTNIGDDGMEPEGELVNSAIWQNRVEDALSGISGAPINVGPIFIMYNEVVDHWIRSIKFNHGYGVTEGHGRWFVYHNTLMTTVVAAEHPNEGWDDGDGLRVPGFDGGMKATFRNNIFHGTDRAIDDTQRAEDIWGKKRDLDYDNVWRTPHHDPSRFVMWENERYAGFLGFQSLTCIQPTWGNGCQEENGMSADPLYVDGAPDTPPEDKDLNLTSNSPLIDRGVVIPGINDTGPFRYAFARPDIGANEFGRPGEIFTDGFESGGSSRWSKGVP